MESNKFIVNWSGSYPCLCSGVWSISYAGKSFTIPEDILNESMNTYITYSTWHFEDWSEVFEDACDGLEFDAWIEENSKWVDENFNEFNIEKIESNYRKLYDEIQIHDFRRGSCGGCI